MMQEKNKIIGIVTWYGPANYGSGLQAFALKRFLELNEYHVVFIEDCRCFEISEQHSKFNQILNKITSVTWWKKRKYRQVNISRLQMQEEYIKEFCEVMEIKSNDDIRNINSTIDLFVSGGDQIWNPTVTKPYLMLSFIDSCRPKISYGTSVGIKVIPCQYHDKYRQYLSSYKYISVREEQSKEALENIIDNPIQVVVDPTLLLTLKEWDFLLRRAKIDKSQFLDPYIFCYFVGERHTYWNYVEKIRKKTGYKVLVLPINDEGYNNKYLKYVKTSPAEFLWLIKNASIVCTDSFHATVFSMQFGKDFYILKRFIDSDIGSQNGRLYNLLSQYEIRDRIVEDEADFKIAKTIDYDNVWKKMAYNRGESRKWLKNVLESI